MAEKLLSLISGGGDKSVDFIKTAIYLILQRVDEDTFAKYLYLYLSEHPDQAKKLYRLFKIGEVVIENGFKNQLRD